MYLVRYQRKVRIGVNMRRSLWVLRISAGETPLAQTRSIVPAGRLEGVMKLSEHGGCYWYLAYYDEEAK